LTGETATGGAWASVCARPFGKIRRPAGGGAQPQDNRRGDHDRYRCVPKDIQPQRGFSCRFAVFYASVKPQGNQKLSEGVWQSPVSASRRRADAIRRLPRRDGERVGERRLSSRVARQTALRAAAIGDEGFGGSDLSLPVLSQFEPSWPGLARPPTSRGTDRLASRGCPGEARASRCPIPTQSLSARREDCRALRFPVPSPILISGALR